MIKKLLIILALLSTPMLAYNDVKNVYVNNSVTKSGDYVRVSVKCDKGSCTVDYNTVNRARMLSIAKMKSTKSWAKAFKDGTAVRYLKTIRVSDTRCVIVFILCHSSNIKMYDNAFGIEILYNDKK